MEYILVLIFIALIYLSYIVQRFFTSIEKALRYYEKHYLVFSREDVEGAYGLYKEEENKLHSAQQMIKGERILNHENEVFFREYKKQEIYTSRAKEHLSLMLESNLSVLNGKKKIQEAIGTPLGYWLDSAAKEEEKIEDFIQQLKKKT